MKTNQVLNNFSAGEWDPRLKGRSDLEPYKNALASLKNFIVDTGGAAYRGGWELVTIDDATAKARIESGADISQPRLIPYVYPNAPDFNVLVGFFNGGTAPYADTCYILPSGAQPTVESGIVTPYFSTIYSVTYVQVGEYLIITSRNHEPIVFYFDGFAFQLKKFFTLAEQFATAPVVDAYPYQQIQAFDSSVTLTPSATTGSITLTASASFFTSAMIGRIVKISDGAVPTGFCRITSLSSVTVANATVIAALPGTAAVGGSGNPDSFWQMSAWGPGSIPWTVANHQGRLVFFGSDQFPTTLWGSRVGNMWHFNEVPSAVTSGPLGFANGAYLQDNSRAFSVAAASVSGDIRGMVSMRDLLIQTSDADVTVESQTGFGPLDIQFKTHTRFGSANVQGIQVRDSVYFLSPKNELISFKFSFEQDQYKGSNMSVLARHYRHSKDVYDWQKRPAYLVSDGDRLYYSTRGNERDYLYCFSLDEELGVSAWSELPIGVPSNKTAGSDNPFIMSMAFLPGITYGPDFVRYRRDRVYAFLNPGASSDGNFLCVLNPPWNMENSSVESFAGRATPSYLSPYHLDFRTTAANVSTYVWEVPSVFNWGAVNANGNKVHVIADGSYLGEFTCDSSNRITLPGVFSAVVVGLYYHGEIVTMPFSEQGQNGPTHGRPRRIHEAVIRFYKTLGGKFGRADQTHLDEIPFRDPLQPMNQPTDFFSGEKRVAFPAGYERDYAVKIVQNLPFPMYVSYVAMNGISYD